MSVILLFETFPFCISNFPSATRFFLIFWGNVPAPFSFRSDVTTPKIVSFAFGKKALIISSAYSESILPERLYL